jgi:hypothetical protein
VSRLKSFAASAVLAGFMVLASLLPGYAASTDGTVFDSKLMSRMSFSSAQAAKVKAILDKSEVAIIKVFGKYGINPRAKPDFDKLRAASTELQAVEAWEKQQMKRILSKDQYADYLEIMQATAAAVIKATRDD